LELANILSGYIGNQNQNRVKLPTNWPTKLLSWQKICPISQKGSSCFDGVVGGARGKDMEMERVVKITGLLSKIEKELMNDPAFLGCEMNRMKLFMDDNEFTVSFTKKGHRSAMSKTTKEYWKE
jgi:hypothetical protein